jgi:hypothetical protein
VTLGTDDFETVKSGVIISSKKQGKIQSKVELIDKVMVYDVSGKLIKERRRLKIRIDTFRYKCTRTGFIVKVFLINGTI